MLSHGDELGRTQRGNNNGYCQDNELTWIDWDLSKEDAAHLAFTRRVVQMRKDHATLRRRRFFRGAASHGGESDLGDIAWFTPDAGHMTDEAWNTSFARFVMVFLNGDRILEPGPRGERIVDDSLLILLNADTSALGFVLPPADYGATWSVVLDTNERLRTATAVPAGGGIRLEAHSVGGALPAVPGPLIHGCGPSRRWRTTCSGIDLPASTRAGPLLRRRPGACRLLPGTRGHRPVPVADPAGCAGIRRMATTWSTMPASARSLAGGRHSSGWRARPTPGAWASSSTWSPTTWRFRPPST